jgi:hypothetical protein
MISGVRSRVYLVDQGGPSYRGRKEGGKLYSLTPYYVNGVAVTVTVTVLMFCRFPFPLPMFLNRVFLYFNRQSSWAHDPMCKKGPEDGS